MKSPEWKWPKKMILNSFIRKKYYSWIFYVKSHFGWFCFIGDPNYNFKMRKHEKKQVLADLESGKLKQKTNYNWVHCHHFATFNQNIMGYADYYVSLALRIFPLKA